MAFNEDSQSSEASSFDINLPDDTAEDTSGSVEKASLLRLTLREKEYRLEKGIRRDGKLDFEQLSAGSLVTALKPETAYSDRTASAFARELANVIPEEHFQERAPLAVIFPDEWGRFMNLPDPGDLADDDLLRHISWTMKITGWEDEEPFRFNFRREEGGSILVVAIRERVYNLAKAIADRLSLELEQVSLISVAGVNIMSEERLPAAKAMVPAPDFEETAEPEEDTDYEYTYDRKRRSPVVFIIPAAVILIAILGYLLLGMYDIRLFGPPAEEEIIAEEAAPSETTSPAVAYSGIIRMLAEGTRLDFLMITPAYARAEMSIGMEDEFSAVLTDLRQSNIAAAAEPVTTSDNTRTLRLQFNPALEAHLTGGSREDAIVALAESGFQVNEGIFTGGLEQTIRMVDMVEEKGVKFYRITIMRIGEDIYRTRLEL